MMHSLASALTPRHTVFDKSYRDLVLDLSDLDKFSADARRRDDFFAETHVTQGMRQLHEAVFRRLEGSSADGIFKLTQAMGGGKTHNMFTVGLLAEHPHYHTQLAGLYATGFRESAKVIAFTGRNRPEGGIAGYIASQLGKSDLVAERLARGEALDQNDWICVLQGPPTLILLDELPPYFAYLSTLSQGTKTQAESTAYTLSNLLNAVNKEELSNVALVLSDLQASYREGSAAIQGILDDFERETQRSAKNFTPVQQNTNEVYQILRKRLFREDIDEAIAGEVAKAYEEAVTQAHKLELTNESGLRIAEGIRQSYPFHPSLRDLYARFKENPGFMQTRGLIRLMRAVVARLYDPEHGRAESTFLIHPYDVDPNDADTLAELHDINKSLDNAISNDIASGGQAVAEKVDAGLGTDLAGKFARLLLMASLPNVKGATKGLTPSEYMAALAAPGHDLSVINAAVLPGLAESSWYLHSDNAGRRLYRDVQNVASKINDYRKNLNQESIRRQLAEQLEALFRPESKDLYQQLYVLAAPDEIEVSREKVSLVIYSPHTSGELHPDLQRLYDDTEYKNRVLFLTGDKMGMSNVEGNAAAIRATQAVLDEFKADKIPANDPQMIEAQDMLERRILGLYAAVQSVFNKLYFPSARGLTAADINLQFKRDSTGAEGEAQITQSLSAKRKFTTEVNTEGFIRELEQKLIGTKANATKPWRDVVDAAARTSNWLLHHPKALEDARDEQIRRDHWRKEGDFISVGPFPKPDTEIVPRVASVNASDPGAGKHTIRVEPKRGDKVYYRYGTEVTPENGIPLLPPYEVVTDEMEVAFIAVDTEQGHPTGKPYVWRSEVELLRELEQQGDQWRVEFEARPHSARIRYTTDGSDPRQHGGSYEGPFTVPPRAKVLAYAVKDRFESKVITVDIPKLGEQGFQIDDARPATYAETLHVETTAATMALLDHAERYKASLLGIDLEISAPDQGYINYTTAEDSPHSIAGLRSVISVLQTEFGNAGQLSLKLQRLGFASGADFKDFARDQGLTYQNKHVDQA